MTTENVLHLTEDEYRNDIYDLFCQFDFDTAGRVEAGEDVPLERQCMDVNVMQMLFDCLGKPLLIRDMKSLENECQRLGLHGVNYPMFERIYLQRFPYDPGALLAESFNVLDQNAAGFVTLNDLKRVAEEFHSTFTEGDLAAIINVLGTDGKISREDVEKGFRP